MAEKVIQLENNNSLIFRKDPRLGTWSVSFERGGIPDVLKGQWTRLSALEARAINYIQNRPARNRTTVKD